LKLRIKEEERRKIIELNNEIFIYLATMISKLTQVGKIIRIFNIKFPKGYK
jgi:hypothetical protein